MCATSSMSARPGHTRGPSRNPGRTRPARHPPIPARASCRAARIGVVRPCSVMLISGLAIARRRTPRSAAGACRRSSCPSNASRSDASRSRARRAPAAAFQGERFDMARHRIVDSSQCMSTRRPRSAANSHNASRTPRRRPSCARNAECRRPRRRPCRARARDCAPRSAERK